MIPNPQGVPLNDDRTRQSPAESELCCAQGCCVLSTSHNTFQQLQGNRLFRVVLVLSIAMVCGILSTLVPPFEIDKHNISFTKRLNFKPNTRFDFKPNEPPRKLSDTTNPVYFIHIGKTGGSSVDNFMTKFFNRQILKKKFKGSKHYDWSYIEKRGDARSDVDVITFLRDPASRAVSHFYFAKKMHFAQKFRSINQTFGEYINDDKSLEQFQTPVLDGLGGVYWLSGTFYGDDVHWLSGKNNSGFGWVMTGAEFDDGNNDIEWKNEINKNHTAVCLRAARKLDQTLWFGILEDIPRSMELLQVSTELKLRPRLPNRNKSPVNYKQPSLETIEKTKSYLPMDMWLYDYAKALFEARYEYFVEGSTEYKHPDLPPFPNFEDEFT